MTIVLPMTAATTWARNIDLSTVPMRDAVQLTIYNSEDITLVREVRKVSFKRGVNPLQFSWANTLIDPTSVELRSLTSPDRLELLDTTYPHGKPQMLYWNVQSEFDGEAAIEITYFTSGVTWSSDYVCVADNDEKSMSFEGFVRVGNNSGEDYDNAQIRLVVGTINLVEKIAQLAQIPMSEVDELGGSERQRFRRDAAKSMMMNQRAVVGAMYVADSMAVEEKEIYKEGLSEYFIYTIDGAETVPHGWSKRMRSFDGGKVPYKVQYRYRENQYGDRLARMCLLTNDKASNLGATPLPDGIVRIFRDNGRDGLSFVASQPIKYVPIGDKIEIDTGTDPNVVFELVKARSWRDNIWMWLQGADIYRRVEDGNTQIDIRSAVAGWNDHELFTQRIGNYTAKPIEVEVRRALPGHVTFRSSLDPTLHDYQTVQYTAAVIPATRAELHYEVVRFQGRNAKQSNVTLENANVTVPW
jgi:hypothetical protein